MKPPFAYYGGKTGMAAPDVITELKATLKVGREHRGMVDFHTARAIDALDHAWDLRQELRSRGVPDAEIPA